MLNAQSPAFLIKAVPVEARASGAGWLWWCWDFGVDCGEDVGLRMTGGNYGVALAADCDHNRAWCRPWWRWQ